MKRAAALGETHSLAEGLTHNTTPQELKNAATVTRATALGEVLTQNKMSLVQFGRPGKPQAIYKH